MLWLLAAAAQLTAPAPIDERLWFVPSDLPVELLPANEAKFVRFSLTVGPDGKPQDCRVERTSGIPTLDAFTCKLAERRARFHAARGADGRPAYGVYRTSVRWLMASGYLQDAGQDAGDALLTVNRLPGGLSSPASVNVTFALDRAGNMSSCSAQPGSAHAALAQVACRELLKGYRPIPATSAQGAAVDSVQTATVTFVTG